MRIQLLVTWLSSSQPGNGHKAFVLLSPLVTAITLSVSLLDTVEAPNLVFCFSRILLDLGKAPRRDVRNERLCYHVMMTVR